MWTCKTLQLKENIKRHVTSKDESPNKQNLKHKNTTIKAEVNTTHWKHKRCYMLVIIYNISMEWKISIHTHSIIQHIQWFTSVLPSASVGLGLVSGSWSCCVLHDSESSCCNMVGQISCRPGPSTRDCSVIPYTARASAAKHWKHRTEVSVTHHRGKTYITEITVCTGAPTPQDAGHGSDLEVWDGQISTWY